MRTRRFPRCDFPCNPDDLIRVVCFGDAEKLAASLYVTVDQIERWRMVLEPVPYVVYRAAVSLDDLLKLKEYRRLDRLVVWQAETIERLIAERNFYKEQCHREAKFGMMINTTFNT